jgi:hypothetical protein
LKERQKLKPNKKFILYDFHGKRPDYFIETDGSVWKVIVKNDGCLSCSRACCDIFPPSYPEFNDGKGGCKLYIQEKINGVLRGRCKRHFNKPFGCALYPFNNPKNLTPERRFWDEKNCNYAVRKIG